MNTPRETTRPSIGHRALAVVLVATALLMMIGYATRSAITLGRIAATQRDAFLALPLDHALALDGLGDGDLRAAIAASPLNQASANVAMVRLARQGRTAEAARWLAVLPRLGWRDTASLQNLLYDAVLTQNAGRVLDFSDGLLRRRKLSDQMFPLIAVMEADPAFQNTLAARLATGVNWRDVYLGNTGLLTSRQSLLMRFMLLRTLQQRGAQLGREEIVPNINALDRGGLPAHGFALWRTITPQVRRPLDDTDFATASRYGQSADQLVPYQWQLMTGEGFNASAVSDDGTGRLDIEWNGRGVPVFAQQRTSATPGRYTLAVSVPARDRGDLRMLTFRLMCDATAIAFEPAGTGHYVTVDRVPCAYPVLQIAGDVQSFATANTFSIDRIVMTPLASANR